MAMVMKALETLATAERHRCSIRLPPKQGSGEVVPSFQRLGRCTPIKRLCEQQPTRHCGNQPMALMHLHTSSEQDTKGWNFHIVICLEGSFELMPSGPESAAGAVQDPGSGAAPDAAVAEPVGAA